VTKDTALQATEIDLKAVLGILRRQRRTLAITMVVVASLALAYLFVATRVYTSTVLIQVDGRSSNLLDPSSSAQEQSAVLNSRVDSEVEILRSEATALAVVREMGLIRDPEFGPQIGWLERLQIALGTDLDWNRLRRVIGLGAIQAEPEEALVKGTLQRLQQKSEVRRRGLTYLIAVSVTSESPQRAAEIANTYARVYIERQVSSKTDATVTARDVIRRQIEIAQGELATSENAINGFIEENLARLEDETGDPAVAGLRARLEAAKSSRAQTRSRIASAEAALATGDWDAVAITLGDEAVAELARQRAELEARLGQLDENQDEALDLQAELASIDANLVGQSNSALLTLRDDMDSLDSREAEARDQLRNILLESDISAELLADLFSLQQRATVARDQYQALLAREQDLGALANLQIADARIVSEALPPNNASFPNTKLLLALALIGGLGFGTALAFVKEFFFGGIVSASQLSNVLQAPVPVSFGVVPEARSGEDPANIVALAPMSLYAETFRKLRAAIDVGVSRARSDSGDQGQRGRVILVCSALQAEGKSTTAIALARTYALAGVKTVLIDADMRKPTIGIRMHAESNLGLINWTSQPSIDEDQKIKLSRDELSPLAIMPAGARSSAPTDQLLNGEAFRTLLASMMNNFDVVIIDSPPVLPVVDARYLASHADVIIHVVRYGETTQGEVREASVQLREHLSNGVSYFGVLNLEERSASSYYGGYSYYGDETT
jgi:succinoglycan biosynthesis transport protein ExoP